MGEAELRRPAAARSGINRMLEFMASAARVSGRVRGPAESL
jgi:hypothetical protein